eukprot:589520-Amphidinium_carterae.1
MMRSPTRRFSLVGAYVMIYNYEPNLIQLTHITSTAKVLRVHEIWDYSHGNLEFYSKHTQRPFTFRYFPPGCAKALQLAPSQSARTRDEAHVGFAGKWMQRSAYSRKVFNASGAIRDKSDADSRASWRTFLE